MAGNLFVVDALEIKWGKSLMQMQMPFLTIKEIEFTMFHVPIPP